MAKQLNSYSVNLAFTTDAKQAQTQLQNLQTQLNNLSMRTINLGNFQLANKQIIDTTQAVSQLKIQLQEATNVNTGKLDLGKFQQSLKKSGIELKDYQAILTSLGPEGSKAFASLASSITQAEIPLRRSNALLSELWTTLKNTARWQISSSLLHGFMGSIQKAYGYAKDLNESLTSIRIVTGQSTDEMAKFAEKANKAAKNLSTTTTAYTDAALIFYQQGLGDKQVEEYTNVTMKMANVTGDAADEVSSYMTAIWNNFNKDGTESAEHFADVITALGAATASSSAEIADGLQKFSAIADTVGLSYDYATTALATVVAKTRESADVVGTAFKTIFARLEGLKLGETADDGTDLNKYSEALAKVGVSIKETVNGVEELRDMDDVLDDLAAKWETLNADEQMALAQTVAGVRQYNTLIALMNNWGDFQKNLSVAQGSEGSLQEQADIYAESWEAAQKRVKASMETIYQALLDDQFFIKLTNGFAKFLDTINNTIEGLGGLKGVLLVLTTLITTKFGNEISKSLQNTVYNMKMLTKAGRESVKQMRDEATQGLINSTGSGTVGTNMSEAYKQQGALQDAYIKNAEKMDETQRKIAADMLDQQKILIKNISLQAEDLENQEKGLDLQERKIKVMAADVAKTTKSTTFDASNFSSQLDELRTLSQKRGTLDSFMNSNMGFTITGIEDVKKLDAAMTQATNEGKNFKEVYGDQAGKAFGLLRREIRKVISGNGSIDEVETKLQDLWNATGEGSSPIDDLRNKLTEFANGLDLTDPKQKALNDELQDFIAKANNAGSAGEKLAQSQKQLSTFTKQTADAFSQLAQKNTTAMQSLVALTGALSSVAMSITSIIGLIDTWNNEDMSGGEKLLATMTTLGMVIPMVARAFGAENRAHILNIGLKLRNALASEELTIAEGKLVVANTGVAVSLWSILWPLLAITAAIAALTFGIVLLVKRSKQLETENKQAKTDLNNTKDAFDELNNSISETNSLLDGLPDRYSSLQDMEYGTAQWREAVTDLNNELSDTIDKYNLLEGQDWYRDSQGVIHLTDEGTQSVKDQQNKLYNSLQTSKTASENRVNETENALKVKDIKNKIYDLPDEEEKEKTKSNGHWKSSKHGTERVWVEDKTPNPRIAQQVDQKYSLNDEDVQKLIQLKLNDAEFDFGDKDALIDAGIDESLAEVVSSNDDLQTSLDELTQATIKAKEAYTQNIANDLISQGLDLSQYDWIPKELRSGLLTLIAENTGENSKAYQEDFKAGELGGKTQQEWINQYLEDNNYKGFGDNGFQDFMNGNNTITTYKTDENGNQTNDKIIIDEDKIAAWAALKVAEEEALKTVEDYEAVVVRSQQAWQAANEINPAWDAQKQSLEELKGKMEELESIDPRNMLHSEEIDGIREDINELKNNYSDFFEKYKDQFADIAGLSKDSTILEETFGNSEWIVDNLEDIEDALGGDAEAVNKLRKKIADLPGYLEECTQAWLTQSDAVKKYFAAVDKGQEPAEEVINSLKDDLIANSAELSGFAHMTQGTFENLVKNQKGFAQKAAAAFRDAMNGSKDALTELRAEAARGVVVECEANIDDAATLSRVQTLREEIIDILSDPVEAKAQINTEEFKAKCTELAALAQMTTEQVETFFGNMGYGVQTEVETVDIPEQDWTETTLEGTGELDSDGHEKHKPVEHHMHIDAHQIQSVPAIKTLTEDPGVFGKNIVKEESTTPSGKKVDDENPTGGGEEKPKTHNTKKLKDEKERYQVIKNKIEDLSRAYEQLGKAKDRAFGTAKLKLIDDESASLEKQIQLQKEYLKEIEEYAKFDEQTLMSAASWAGISPKIENGVITNYDQIIEAAVNKYNQGANSLMLDDAFESGYEEPYDDLKEAIEQYNETHDLLLDEQAKLTDLLNEAFDKKLEKVQYQVELRVSINEDDMEYFDYMLSKIEDDAYAAAEAIALLGDETETTLSDIKAYTQGLEDLLANHGIKIDDLNRMSVQDLLDLGFTEDEIDSVREWKSALLEANSALLEMRKTIQEKMLENFEQMTDDIERQTDLLEHYESIVSTVKNITGLLGSSLGKQARDLTKALNQTLTQNSITKVASGKQTYDGLVKTRAEAYEAYQKALATNDKESIKEWEDTLKEIDDKVNESQETMLENWEDALSLAAEMLEEAVDEAAKEFDEALSPIFGTLDQLSAAFDRATEIDEDYLKDYEQIYELSKLNREIAGSIEDADLVQNKKALAKLQAEINDLQKNGTKLSEYDLNVLRKKYELELARQQLEDSKNAKSIVNLTKDSEGNWGYVYTADTDEIAKAEQEYENKLKEWQDLNSEYIQNLQSDIINLEQEAKDALTEVWNDSTLTTEEKETRTKEIYEWYQTQTDYLISQLNNALVNHTDTTALMNDYYKTNADLVDSFEETNLSLLTGITNLTNNQNMMLGNLSDYLDKLREADEKFKETTKKIGEAAGVSIEDYPGFMDVFTDDVDEGTKNAADAVKEMTDSMAESFKEVLDYALDWEVEYGKTIDEAINKNEKLVLTLNKMIRGLGGELDTSIKIDNTSNTPIEEVIPADAQWTGKTKQNGWNLFNFDLNNMSGYLGSMPSFFNSTSGNLLSGFDDIFDLVKSGIKSIDSNVFSMFSSLNNIFNAPPSILNHNNQIDQNVRIEASFPNVQNHSEIEEAFTNLVNEAAQYANRKR